MPRALRILPRALTLAVLLLPWQDADAAGFAVLHTFAGGSDGAEPFTALIADSAGNLYGTTEQGGASNCPYVFGCGTISRVAPSGAESVLYTFCSKTNCTDGDDPAGNLVADKANNLYGVTSFGGAHNAGAVFRLTPAGGETVLYSFGGGSDGETPQGGLIRDKKGNLYGATAYGGANNFGAVFKLAQNGTETVLYSFKAGSDGAMPLGNLLADSAGNLYGATATGGDTADCPPGEADPGGCGTIFKLTPGGTETVLYVFTGGHDGQMPNGGLIADATGDLFGTTQYGGGPANCPASQYRPAGCGVVFRLSPGGTETVLHAFENMPDGATPRSGVIADASGNLYGTAYFGGQAGEACPVSCGIVFKLATNGAETILESFDGVSAGGPWSNLLLRKNVLYGTTILAGGTACEGTGCGTVYRVSK